MNEISLLATRSCWLERQRPSQHPGLTAAPQSARGPSRPLQTGDLVAAADLAAAAAAVAAAAPLRTLQHSCHMKRPPPAAAVSERPAAPLYYTHSSSRFCFTVYAVASCVVYTLKGLQSN